MKIDVKNVLHCANHIKDLAALAKIEDYDALELYQGLKKLDNAVCRYNENCCNLPDYDDPKKEANHIKRVKALFGGKLPKGFFINGDPRGYALKINDPKKHYPRINLYQDFGGYGILAPDFLNF